MRAIVSTYRPIFGSRKGCDYYRTGRRGDLRAYARQPARGVKSGGWGAKAAIVVVVVAVVVVVGDGVVGGVAVIVAVVVCVNINVMLGQHSPR